MAELVFLKLGGSLITDKTRPYTPRPDRLADLATQIASALAASPDLQLILGHGSGSFGHTAAKEHATLDGIPDSAASPEGEARRAEDRAAYWRGFAEVRLRAAELNGLVMHALHAAGLTAVAFPPSAAVIAGANPHLRWDLSPMEAALKGGLLPVIYGDAVFHETRGGTILSTEDLFEHLARHFSPARILLAGLEAGVWEDFPARTRLMGEINPRTFESARAGVGQAAGVDVTGGMESKVRQMLRLAGELGLKAVIFSGEEPGQLKLALQGAAVGTAITA